MQKGKWKTKNQANLLKIYDLTDLLVLHHILLCYCFLFIFVLSFLFEGFSLHVMLDESLYKIVLKSSKYCVAY